MLQNAILKLGKMSLRQFEGHHGYISHAPNDQFCVSTVDDLTSGESLHEPFDPWKPDFETVALHDIVANKVAAPPLELAIEMMDIAAKHAAGCFEQFSTSKHVEAWSRAFSALLSGVSSLEDCPKYTPPNVCRRIPKSEVVDFSDELAWLKKNAGRYKGKWVAVKGCELIAFDVDADPVFEAVEASDIDCPFVVFVEEATENSAFAGVEF